MRSRVGFYGGAFDPPHVGHQATALYALECANISELIVAPIYIHPDGKQMAPFLDRVRMTADLLDPLRQYKPVRVTMLEEAVAQTMPERPGLAADTMEFLRQLHMPVRKTIVMVLGADLKEAFPKWEGHERLEAMQAAGDLEVFWVDRSHPASSTQVRAAVRLGTDTRRLLPPRIRHYINQKGLYL